MPWKSIHSDVDKNMCYQYAASVTHFRKGKYIEIMVNYEPSRTFTEWWKQLYGESEGKDQKAFPAGVDFN